MSNTYFYDWNNALPALKADINKGKNLVYEGTLNCAEAEKSWTPSQVTLDDWNGILEVTALGKEYGYGVLFYNDPLPKDIMVEFNYIFPPGSAHDMNFMFPFKEKKIIPEGDLAKDPHTLCIWSICGWGGQLTGVEVPTEKVKNASVRNTSVKPEPGLVHNLVWANKDGVQTLIIDDNLIYTGILPAPINTDPGYFAFDIYGAGSSIILGDVKIYDYK